MKYLGGEISYMDVYHDDDRSSLLRAMGKPCLHPGGGRGPGPAGGRLPAVLRRLLGVRVQRGDAGWDCLKSRTPEEWARRMLLRHIRRTPAGE